MTDSPNSPFNEFETVANEQGTDAALDFLESHLRGTKDHYGLFEVLKMKARHNMGLALTYGSAPDEIEDDRRLQLEDRLIGCCREIGQLFFADGRIEEGWMYLQPVGDGPFVESLLRKIPVTDENVSAIIDVALYQGVAPGFGYAKLLEHSGTCNGITAFDVHAGQFDKPTRATLASLLVNHLYNDLLTNVRTHVAAETKSDVSGQSLGQLLEQYDWIARQGGHHTDATHLASAIRIARFTEGLEDIGKAIDLANYGLRLPEDFQYPSDPPFESTYADHLMYFRVLVDQDVDRSIEYFREKATALDVEGMGTVGWEVLIEILTQVDRRDEALEIAIDKLVGEPDSGGMAPSVFEIPETAQQYEKLAQVFRERDELLGFAIGKLKAKSQI